MTVEHPASAGAEWQANWPLVATAAMGMALAGAMNTMLGLMMVPIEQEFGWTRAQISSGSLIVSAMALFFATGAGYMIDRLGARHIAIMVVSMMSGSMMLLATTTDNIWHWWAVWGIFAIAATATATVWIAPVSSRFDKGRGLAIAITIGGTAISSAVLPMLAQYLIEQHGWRAGYLVVGAIFACSTVPLTLFCWRGPGTEPQIARKTAEESPATLPGLTIREAFASKSFIFILIAQLISMLANMALTLNLIPILIDTKISAGEAAAIVGVQGVVTIVGKFFGGWALDRLSAKWLVAGAALGSVALPVVLASAPGSVPLTFAIVAFHGLMSSVKYPGMVFLLSRHVGSRSFGTLFGLVSTTSAIGAGISPVVANHIYDVTRSYELVLWSVIPLFVFAAAFFAALGRYPDFEKG
jgi:MFS family permease